MSGWASLSGYLQVKPGGGGLSILKSRRRLWCVLEESQGRLLYFKSEDDSRSKPPLGYVELRGAAITLDMDNNNQFVIILLEIRVLVQTVGDVKYERLVRYYVPKSCITADLHNGVDGKEIILTAENHESMMIWMMALQARRDQFALGVESRSSSTSTENDFDPDHNFLSLVESRERVGFDLNLSDTTDETPPDIQSRQTTRNFRPPPFLRSSSDLASARIYTSSTTSTQPQTRQHRPLESTQSLQVKGQGPSVGFLGRSPDWRREQLKRMGETIDNAHPSAKIFEKDRSQSLPPLLEESSLSYLNPGSRQMSLSLEMSERLQRTQQQASAPGPGQYVPTSSCSSTSTDTSDEPCPDVRHRIMHKNVNFRDSRKLRTRTGSLQVEIGTDLVSSDGDRLTELEKELIATKCELAKVLNSQTCFHEILKQKDEIIEDLDEKLGSKTSSHETYDSKRRMSTINKDYQERVRVLQNQNRFLNEEVRRLAKLRNQEHDKIKVQESIVRSLEADIEVWKLEYISLIQSSIRFTGTDTMDDAELSLFGGDRHKHRILALLEEARKINPSLPTYEHLASGEVHVDCYGFKHHFSDDGLLLHYLCQELSQHFLCQASSYEKHQKNWTIYLRNKSKCLMSNKKELKALVRAGIPDSHRRQMWRTFVLAQVEDIVIEKGAHYFRSLCSAAPDSPLAARYRKQISLDLMRTMPSNVKFSTPGSKGIMDLQDILLAFCIHNPTVGYCQGMNFLVAMALLFMDAQDAFWTLVAITERYHSPSYFDHNLLGAQADQMVLHDLMVEKLPELAKHLDAIDIEISTVTLNWFLAIFFDAVPFHTLLRIWDCFLLEGPKVLFRFSLAILHMHSKEIIVKCDTISVMRHLKTCAKITYDVDGLVRAAFKTLKPFSRRQDIVSKQTFYLNTLKEKYRFRDMHRGVFAERENYYLSMEADADNYTGFECCVITRPGEAWVAYGEPPIAKICIVDCREQTMTDTTIKFDSRVMSMAESNQNMVLIGTLSWFVIAYDLVSKEMCWQQRVHDAVLSMQVYKEDDPEHSNRLFAGLADGTMAVFETISLSCTNYDLLYIPIGQSPVTCLKLLGNQLWCACGNTVSIIHASTLDPMDRFQVSANPYDTVLSLVPGLPGVWISVRGSSVLELWDPMSLSCKMLYDIRTGKYPNLRKEDDTYFNAARITSILALDYSVWVGTGEGTLITFDVFTQNQRTPSDASPFILENRLGNSEMEAQSWRSSVSLSQMSDCESYARLLEVERRVKDLYIQRLTDESQADNETGIDPGMEEESCNSSVENVQKSKKSKETRPKMGENILMEENKESRRKSLDRSWNKDSTSSQSKNICFLDSTLMGDTAGRDSANVGNKQHVRKTASADSAVTNTSGLTNISYRTEASASPSDTCCADTVGGISENISLHDSGFTQTSAQTSGSSSQTDSSADETLRQNTSHEEFQSSLSTETGSTLANDFQKHLSENKSSSEITEENSQSQIKSSLSDSSCQQTETILKADTAGINSQVDPRDMSGDDRKKNKSEDSGISLVCKKNLAEKISSEKDRRKSSLEHILPVGNHSQQTSVTEGQLNIRNKMHTSSSDQVNPDSCMNASNKVFEKTADPKFAENISAVQGKECHKSNPSLESNGRSKSQDSNRTVGSDDVFQAEQEFAQKHHSCEDTDGKKSQNYINNDSSVFSASINTSDIVCKDKYNSLEANLSNGVCLNGDITESDSSDQEIVSKSDNLEKKPHQISLQTASVKSLTAKFEAKVSRKDTECSKLNLRRSRSLKMNFKPLVPPKNATEKKVTQNSTPYLHGREAESHTEMEKLDGKISCPAKKLDGLECADSASNEQRVLDSGPVCETNLTTESSDNSAVTSHEKRETVNGNTQIRYEILAATAPQLGKELESAKSIVTSQTVISSTSVSGSEHATETQATSEVKSQPQLQTLSVQQIDTRFYGDSDEDSCVHEARVQSFKDSYKRLSVSNLKCRAPGDIIQENTVAASDKNSSTLTNSNNVVAGGSESKQITSSGSTVVPENSNRKSSIPGLSSVVSAFSKKIPLSTIGRQSSDASIVFGNVQPHEPEAQWRLDYTNIHVDTDHESTGMSSISGGESDSHPPSRRLSCVSMGSDAKNQRMNQFLRDTANTFSSQLGFPLEDEKDIAAFLSTPTSGDRDGSVTWSSYDEISTPPHSNMDYPKLGQGELRLPRSSIYSMDSRTSIASTMDMFYRTDLSLLSKNKISDKPVKWLVATESQGKPVVLSFSGCHSDDEAVLIWSREANETLWTNCPVFEYNPTTRMATLPRYMIPQMSSSSSARSSPKQRLTGINSY